MSVREWVALSWASAAVVAAATAGGVSAWVGGEDPVQRPRSAPTKLLCVEPLPPDAPRLSFIDVARRLRLPRQFRGARTCQFPEDMGGGVAVADFDGDGRPDVLLVGSGAMPDGGPTHLLRNDTPSPGAPLVLTDVTAHAGLPTSLEGMAAAVGDADDDGRLDVAITYFGGVKLFRNEGGMRFRDVTRESGLDVADMWCSAACFGDGDGDGRLDLYVCRYVDFHHVEGRRDVRTHGMPFELDPVNYPPVPNLFFRNRGDGTFEERAQAFGIDDPSGRSLGAVFGDFDLDGLPDLFVVNDAGEDAMYHGVRREDGGRGFVDVSYAAAMADPRGAMGVAAADADGDGDDDVFIAHWVGQGNAFYRNLAKNAGARPRDMAFIDAADRVGLGPVSREYVGWATDFVDLDLDGRFDLFVADGSTFEQPSDRDRLIPERTCVFWNAGDPRGFLDAGAQWGEALATPRSLRGGAAADLDGDGDADLVLGAVDGPPAVLVNDGPPRGRPLWIELREPAPNVFAVGARVAVACGRREIAREMRSSPTYASGGPPEILFGLGEETCLARIRVLWPDGSSSETTCAADRTRVVVRKP